MLVVDLIGVGMAITVVYRGVPVLFPGVQISVGISMLGSFQNLQVVLTAVIGSFSAINGQIATMSLSPETLSSLIGMKKVLAKTVCAIM